MFPEVNEQMDVIKRGVEEILPEDELVRKIEKSKKTNKPLIVKEGFDPTAPDLHIGHMISIRKLRDFQELGHTVVFLIGDFTGLVGDPSGRSSIRKMMTRKEIDQNAETYKDQIFKVLDPEKTVVRFNSEWLGKLTIYEFLELTSKQTIARMLERDDFKNRFESETDISMLEFIYPLLQGYDSVALKADVELGGTDQKFNLLMARLIQKRYGVESQAIVMLPLLEGTGGGVKMSKSLNNYIGINEPPNEIFGKVMSIPDSLIYRYFFLATSVSESELENIKEQLNDTSVNPVNLKRKLGKSIVSEYYSEESAEEAELAFDRVFKNKENPLDIDEVILSIDQPVWIIKLLSIAGLIQSNGEGRRLIKQGAVSVNGEKIGNDDIEITIENGAVLKVGKRKFKKIVLKYR
ncbi:tyrosine--tRNA ligase [candidate division KSB1 bacterium]|nr:tyrosine--tRNA ligase [candidate division KSB1 bacterium]